MVSLNNILRGGSILCNTPYPLLPFPLTDLTVVYDEHNFFSTHENVLKEALVGSCFERGVMKLDINESKVNNNTTESISRSMLSVHARIGNGASTSLIVLRNRLTVFG